MSHKSFARLLACTTLLGLMLAFWLPARATTVKGSLLLSVDQFEDGAFGLPSTPTLFEAQFSVDFIGGGNPDPSDLVASLLDFDLTIGNTSWDETMPHSDVLVLVQDSSVLGISLTITNSVDDHPDLAFFLPMSPGAWEAHDIVNGTDNGSISGTYEVVATVVPEPSTLLLLGLGLAGLGVLRRRKQ